MLTVLYLSIIRDYVMPDHLMFSVGVDFVNITVGLLIGYALKRK